MDNIVFLDWKIDLPIESCGEVQHNRQLRLLIIIEEIRMALTHFRRARDETFWG